MGVNISYMGTKRELASVVSKTVESAKDGIFLDAFSGMCSVGEAIGTARQVWSNDTQVFAWHVAQALFASHDEPPSVLAAAEILFPRFIAHKNSLSATLTLSLAAEVHHEVSANFKESQIRYPKISACLAKELPLLMGRRQSLFARLYADSYVGVKQAIEIDSIVASINNAKNNKLLSPDQSRWLTIALGRAVLKCSSTTGHFAQYLQPKEGSYQTFINQRRRSIWEGWLESISKLTPVGCERWRSANKTFNEDSISLVHRLSKDKIRPAIIYADPPYTDDQYSRYYHLLETLILYDYPKVSGKGRYRGKRFQTAFSMRSTVVQAFTDFVTGVAATGADLILSYPSNGLLHEAGSDPLVILKTHFRQTECSFVVPHKHSTMGASKGPAAERVTEFIYMAKA